jgi:steroid delta-isomerase-like uncharacterized protein
MCYRNSALLHEHLSALAPFYLTSEAQRGLSLKEDVNMVEENQHLVQRFIEAFWNQGNMDAADTYLSSDFIAWDEPLGPEGLKQVYQFVHAAFPDLHFSVEDCFATSDRVAVRVIERGTHAGEWQGIPATGNQIAISGTGIYRIAHGRIAQQWFHNDFRTELRQLGARIVPGEV